MTRSAIFFALLLIFPNGSLSTTSTDLRARVKVDGVVSDYESDEWVLDASTDFPEPESDSRWGRDNNIISVAVTWDLYNVYIAVPCVVTSSTLMLFLDTDCGGPAGLEELDFFRRNIHFANFSPNLLLKTTTAPSSALAALVNCYHPLDRLENDRFETWLLQDGFEGGAFETAIPWEVLGRFERKGGATRIPEPGAVIRLLAVVTGGVGTGAGDAAPDPSSVLENDSTRLAICDNALVIPLDADEDGFLDVNVSPRDAATFSISQGSDRRQVLPLRLDLANKVFSPDKGEVLRFLPSLDPAGDSLPAYLTARIYASSGELVTVLYEDLARVFSQGAADIWDQWDGKDRDGDVVPGGIYVLAVSAGPAQGSTTRIVKAALAVIR